MSYDGGCRKWTIRWRWCIFLFLHPAGTVLGHRINSMLEDLDADIIGEHISTDNVHARSLLKGQLYDVSPICWGVELGFNQTLCDSGSQENLKPVVIRYNSKIEDTSYDAKILYCVGQNIQSTSDDR